ncbi:serine/threonine-protein phosphatase [Cyanobacterium stanieri LEGE 03274]|uniref:Serine/threonine-protein phosphatase n=1 Tax=Cyanobacterium stanieri LEGE 03274 TaxID=1828756 RepID=A0ABR9V5X0_9CHRO|nr:PP2C family serine/threonine-protein phosphatase [Cyanobacterium stanieri]MBE9222901.1 serine/threonine-protein phosphatase [Cyanobacterium stanieri LEGE 03274]
MVHIHCINPQCNATNSLGDGICGECNSPTVRRYLWVMGGEVQGFEGQTLIDDRFYVINDHVVLDTKPQKVPSFPDHVPSSIVPYQRLFPQRLHVPQVYGAIATANSDYIWLLEHQTIPLDESGELNYPQIFPTLSSCWVEASPLRQLNWLWQMVQLWYYFKKQKILSSFLAKDNLRVDGGIVKIMELTTDDHYKPTLQDLGNILEPLMADSADIVQEIITNIVLCLQQKLITSTGELIKILDQALFILGENYYQRKYHILTNTDGGKKRGNNEDACYPPALELKENVTGINTLTIVCDGLGGQKGGEIASNLAIDTLGKELNQIYQKQLKDTLYSQNWTPLIDKEKILKAISTANDQIAEINNEQGSKDRDRMGTTVVLTLALDHEVYLGHVGDSRIYLVTSGGCHQLTVDDDLASREVRLGYSFYREMTNNPQAGALIQALGTDYAKNIRPHIKRIIPDEDCILLLCSDGLSDFERVEQYWRREILPILSGGLSLSESVARLMDIALTKNGHDNVTVGLVYCQIGRVDAPKQRQLSWASLGAVLPDLPQPDLSAVTVVRKNNFFERYKFGIAILLVMVGIVLGVVYHQWKSNESPSNSSSRVWLYDG